LFTLNLSQWKIWKPFTCLLSDQPLRYCAHIWHGNLTNEQTCDIERVFKNELFK
jgi:hypothetical protein